MPTALNTLEKLATVTLGTGQTTISFTAIPQTYTDLVVKFSINSASNNQYIRFNNSSAAEYEIQTLRGNGANADNFVTGTGQTELYFQASGIASSTFGSGELYITNYTAATQKSLFLNAVGEANIATVYQNQIASSWSNNAAINRIDIVCASGLGQYSSATLYGVNPVKARALATGGDFITNDGTFWYHAFYSSGTFAPIQTLTAASLVVAGGGAGGGTAVGGGDGGGGGAGGISFLSSSTLTAINYTVTIGAGGSGQTGTTGNNGSNSVFNGITSIGGGGGGGNGGGGNSGGSGGGGGANFGAGGASTQGSSGGATGFGFAGGTSSTWAYNISGGGGAGSVGKNGDAAVSTSTQPPNGGIGLSTWSSWSGQPLTTGFLGGGGAGGKDSTVAGDPGVGGAGGGGNGGVGTGALQPTTGSINTGGGGGGGGGASSQNGAAGGSGLVIIRYAMA